MENYGTPANAGSKKFMGLLCYLGFWIVALLLDEYKNDAYIKSHANASIVLSAVLLISIIVNIIPFLGQLVYCIIAVMGLVFWIMGIVKALQGKTFTLPIVGEKLVVIH